MADVVQYFVVKCANFPSLKTCIRSEKWACKDRVNPPHPREVLTRALENGKVVLIFSVNNCHGWHGYAEMLTPPDKDDNRQENGCVDEVGESLAKNGFDQTEKSTCLVDHWHYFKVKWITVFAQDFGEQCLSSKYTEDMLIDSGPLNKSRNWQEIPQTIGQNLCSLMDKFYAELREKRELKLKEELERIPPPFYDSQETVSGDDTWKTIVNKVEEDLGKIILACPFGSQRYNLCTPESDTDMFIVYQAKTKDVLGFNPPKQTIKNSEHQKCDYTIHEIHRFAELLLSGDPRCVETLFLPTEIMVRTSTEWQELRAGRKHFLNKECLSKYLRDAQGSKGTKQLQKLCAEHPGMTKLTKKMCKLVYVIVRLLQNARNVAYGEDLQVYRENGSPDRQVLMAIRQGDFPLQQAWQIIQELETAIQKRTDLVPEKTKDCVEFTESWLLKLRHKDFLTYPI